MRLDAVIFDMDGLMIDTEAPVQICCQKAAAEMGFDLPDEFYVSALVGRGWTDCHTALTAHFGADFSLDEFMERFRQRWSEHRDVHGIAIKPGLRELFSFLRSRRIPIGVATSTSRDEADVSLRAAGIHEAFDAFVTGDQVTRGKPDPEIYLMTASRLGVAPEGCVALEDSSPGALAASRAGMTTLIIPDNGRMPTPEAMTAAFRVMESLHDARRLLAEWCV
ncbi:MAG: hypothetical protein DMF87_21550 [Acidobacteria bacterium]|nr:MAG: hypothetical protein DMF87_21550 [Acidobacteriota bacterium]